MTIKKRFFTGIEICIVALVVLGGAGGVANWKQARRLNRAAAENIEQATEIDKLVGLLQEKNKEKDELVEKHLENEKQIKADVSRGYSVLYEQAKDIQEENQTPFTTNHLEAAKGYVKVWGYDAMAGVIKWQMDIIQKQQRQTKELLLKQAALERKYLEVKVEYEGKLGDAKVETEKHKSDAKSLGEKIGDFTKDNNWLNNVLFWGGWIAGAYFFISLGGLGLLNGSKNKAAQQLTEVKKAIKTFTEVNAEGNETMTAITKANQIDLDK